MTHPSRSRATWSALLMCCSVWLSLSCGSPSKPAPTPECTSVADCPKTTAECLTYACESGKCQPTTHLAAGAAIAQQTAGDCQKVVCTEAGGTQSVADDTDRPSDTNECTTEACEAGVPKSGFATEGTACASNTRLCDGAGACVVCTRPTDCASGVCQQHQCIAATCIDGAHNGNETSPDCGGPDCNPCGDGLSCVKDVDCSSQVCHDGTCATPDCEDGARNGDETDTDCGGSCGPCATGKTCEESEDCVSLVCTDNICQHPSCTDNVTNGAESAKDCGGPCPSCADGLGCHSAADCASGVCTAGGTCAAPQCGDQVRNGTEECDDANASNNDGCLNTCRSARCGDGFIQTGVEACDDGNTVNTDGCVLCQIVPGFTCVGEPSICMTTCGDGIPAGNEQCDDAPPAENGDGCSATCTVEAGYNCAGSPSICTTVCGDGIRAGAEQCDDGNLTSGDGCSSTCVIDN